MPEILRILYDGWSLVYAPNSPAALHLWNLLQLTPEPVQAIVALPGQTKLEIPERAFQINQLTPDNESSRLTWEQRTLSRLAGKTGAQVIHLTGGIAALLGKIPSIASPTSLEDRSIIERASGFSARLRDALAHGGWARLQMILLPDDLPNDTPRAVPAVRLKPVLAPAFISLPQNSNRVLSGEQRISRLAESSLPLELPGTYVLYHGPGTEPDLQRLLEAWNWATKALGDDTLLVLAGLRSSEISLVNNMLGSAAFQHTVQALPELEIKHLAAVYQGCRAVIHPAPVSPWEVPARLALANGKPLVGVETPWTDAICGPAAYLVPSGGKAEDIPRALGAALISVMVEESLAEGLSQAARQRSAAWLESSSRELFQQQLLEAYRLLTFQNAGGE